MYHSAGHGCFPHASWLIGLGLLHLLSVTSNSTPWESSTQNTSRDLTPCSPSLQLFVHSVQTPISHLEKQSRQMSHAVTKSCTKLRRPCVFFPCSPPPSCWLIHLSRFIAELKIHHLYSLSRLLRYLQRFTQLKSEVNTSVLIGSFLVGILPYGQFPWKW